MAQLELEVQVEESIERGGYCLKLGILISMQKESLISMLPFNESRKKDSV